MQIKLNRKAGFTLVEIMIVVAIIGLLAAIAIPNFVQARQTAWTKGCVNNLRLIDSAKQQLILEEGDATQNLNKAGLTKYLGRGATGEWPVCPMTKLDEYDGNEGDKDTLPACGAYDADKHKAELTATTTPAP